MAISATTFQAIGGAAQDLFSVGSFKLRAEGNRLQAETYDKAAELSLQNKQFAETSAAIKDMQIQRGIYGVLGEQAAAVASSGFEASGSALDLLRDSAAQGALHKAVASQQGLIEEAGYEQQARAYRTQAETARMAAKEADRAAAFAPWSAAIKIASAVASIGMPNFGGGGGVDPGAL